jgi:hypothetical protein
LEDKSNKFKCGYFEKRVANLNKLLEARMGSENPTSDHQFIVLSLSFSREYQESKKKIKADYEHLRHIFLSILYDYIPFP